MRLPNPDLPWAPMPMAAVAMIAEQEQGPGGGPALKAYRCPAGIWTCGWGETEGVTQATRMTADEADRRLCDSLAVRVTQVAGLLKEPATPNQLGAMVSLQYNIGQAAFAKSSVLKLHNAGNHEAAARAFALWNKARNARTGQLEVMPGLVRRRAAEAALYLKLEEDDAPERMPQAVATESRLIASPIAQGGGATAATGAAVALASLGDQVQQANGVLSGVKAAADTVKDGAASVAGFVGVPPGVLVGIVLLVAGYFVLKWRRQQRAEGWV